MIPVSKHINMNYKVLFIIYHNIKQVMTERKQIKIILLQCDPSVKYYNTWICQMYSYYNFCPHLLNVQSALFCLVRDHVLVLAHGSRFC